MSSESRQDFRLAPTTKGKQVTAGSSRPIWVQLLVMVSLSAILGTAAAILMYQAVYADRIYLGVTTADGLDLGGLTREEVRVLLSERGRADVPAEIQLRYGDQEWRLEPQSLGVQVDVDLAVGTAYRVGRAGPFLDRLRVQLCALRRGWFVANTPAIRLPDPSRLTYLTFLATEIDRPAIDAMLVLGADIKPQVRPSQAGRRLDVDEASRRLEVAMADSSVGPLDLPVLALPPAVAEADLEPARSLASRILSAPLVLTFGPRTWTLQRTDLAAMLLFQEIASSSGKRSVAVTLDEGKLVQFMERLAAEVEREPRKPRLEFTGGRVKVIREGELGQKVDLPATIVAIRAGAAGNDRTIALSVVTTTPAGMGEGRAAIKELVAETTTSYSGGLAERRYNVELAAQKLNGVVVGPEEIFSFNEEMGPMTLQAGFKWGWAIAQELGKPVTVPSVAGGICQVSTTLFQAVFWAGYQVEERYPHLYWINRYYRSPTGIKGLDATVDQVYDDQGKLIYALDFKFQNTTPYPILIQARADGNNLTFSLYSTKPGWEVKVEGPKIDDVVPADPAVVRELDPALPAGQEIWVESAQDGFKATVVRRVREPGQQERVLEIISPYQPARNVIKIGPSDSEPPEQKPAAEQP